MSARPALASAIAASALLATISAPAAAQSRRGESHQARKRAARLEGTFVLNGRVTVAVHVNAEHRGQRVSRLWSFTPLCPAGACARVQLARQRQGGTDTLTLRRVRPGYYRAQGRFVAPLGCGGQINPSGVTVRFTITVRVTAASVSSDGPLASRIKATYNNRVRVNNTPCVFPPSHDAAVYRGTLVNPAPTASVRPLRVRPASVRRPSVRPLSALSPAGS